MISERLFLFILLGVTVISATSCALVSKHIQNGGRWYLYYFPSLFSTTSWALIAKHSPISLIVAGTVWDVTYTLVWTGMLIWMNKDTVTWNQVEGALLALVGLLIMSK